MPLYEHILIARQDITTAQVETIAEELQTFIEENNGKVEKIEHWGLRSMAYKVRKNRKGHYVLMNIEADAPVLHEMERKLRINEDVLRTLTIRVDEFKEGQSAILIKREDRKRRPGPR
ncbi:SSU ribosomal protein S6p [hydrothermal vent metagenome]|uniref:SSU ribosomal protein S6p n=1 Tax=hydrothermal vent metagenome TaxID=652676 RepID=A0A3B0RL88_9ZZZZ